MIQLIQLIWKLRNPNLFRTFQSRGSCLIKSRVIAGFFRSLEWLYYTFSIYFLFWSVLTIPPEIQCRYNSRYKSSEKPIIAALISYSVAGSVGSQSAFVWASISRITDKNVSKQIAPHKSEANRMKALSLTLGFSYPWHYFTISNLVRFWYRFWWKS